MNLLNMFLPKYEADTGNGGGDSSSNADENSNKQNQNGDNSSADSQNTDKTIPYSRFKEVNDNYKTVKTQLDKLLQKQQQDDEDAKKKQGEFESLYNDLKSKYDPLEGEINQYRETFKTILSNKLEEVPEEFRELIPQGTEIEQLNWLENAQSKGLFKKNGVQSFGNKGNNPNDSSTEVTKEEFDKMKYTERLGLLKTNPDLYNRFAKN
ncbi:hypothetical protein ACDI16_04225 [Oceanobacillus caeni]|uniref:hypothetical protein n=1 Tax=Virgibacillus sp. SK37 TaxID=403957 RepID=UPI0011A5A8DE|nr:hypothetical protein [Virgibacillus sp. SK37]